jgi:hypothetical protein
LRIPHVLIVFHSEEERHEKHHARRGIHLAGCAGCGESVDESILWAEISITTIFLTAPTFFVLFHYRVPSVELRCHKVRRCTSSLEPIAVASAFPVGERPIQPCGRVDTLSSSLLDSNVPPSICPSSWKPPDATFYVSVSSHVRFYEALRSAPFLSCRCPCVRIRNQ